MATFFRADFTKSLSDVSGNNTKITHGDAKDLHGGAYLLNGLHEKKGGNHIMVGRDDSFFAQRQIEFSLDFKAAKAGDGGSLFRIHNSVQIDVNDNGDVVFRLIGNQKGEKGTITARGVKATDSDWHNVKLTYDADAGKMTGYVDGKAVGSIKVSAATKAAEYWDPMVGSGWDGGFAGYVDNVQIAGKTKAAANKAPVGGADTYTIREDGTARIKVADLLKNDSDANGDALSVSAVRLASGKGKVQLTAGKEVVFTPTKDWSGKAVVEYTLQDAHGAKSVVPVSVNVVKNLAPKGGADTVATREDTPVRIKLADIIKNDSDADGDALTVTGATLKSGKGAVTFSSGKEIVFTPGKDWSGKAVVEYTLRDAEGAQVKVPVTINVAKNVAPKGGADTVTTAEDTPVRIKLSDLTKNDSDADGDALTVTGATLKSGKGAVTFSSGNEIVFTPNKDWSGKAVVEYTLRDSQGAQVKVPVTVNVTEVAEAPPAGAGSSGGATVSVAKLFADASKVFAKAVLINSSKELETALQNAKGGETFLLRGDVEYKVLVKSMKAHSEDVLVTSLDPNDPAIIAKLELRGASKVTFDNLRFEFKGTPSAYQTDVIVRNSTDVSITDSVFKGVAKGYVNYGGTVAQSAVYVTDSKGFTFEGNEVSNFFHGLSISKSQGIELRGNDLHAIQGDGMRFAELKGITIENNWFHDFLGVDQRITHNDYIQFWTTQTTTSSENIVIRGNLLAKGEYNSQSIFMRDELGDANASSPTRYKNVLIEDNFIENWHHHGITISRVDGIIIRDNTLGMMPGGEHKMVSSINVANATGVQVYDNITPKTSMTGTNAIVRNSGNDKPANLIANIAAEHDGKNSYAFDGGYSVNAKGWIKSGDATFNWDFGDGTKATGMQVTHKYANSAAHQVVLTVLHDDGSKDTATLRASPTTGAVQDSDANGSFAFLHHSDPWGV